jgi:glycosyltransferase involved in cell wall biosynthesis
MPCCFAVKNGSLIKQKFMTPLVSVIIPTYNHANFLELALQSVIDQTYHNWEIIVVDNHSTDNTDEIVNKFKEYNIKLFKIHNNGIIGASRNLGIKEAKGEWVAFLDSDDIWYKEKLERSINALQENPDVKVISTDELMVNKINREEHVLHHGPYCPDFYKTLLVSGNRLSTSATLVKKTFLDSTGILFREKKEFVTAEDYDFWMQLAHADPGFAFVRSVQGEYIIHATNHSGQLKRHFASVEAVLKDHVFFIQKFTDRKESLWKFVCARFLLNSAINFFRQRNFGSAVKIITGTLLKQPIATIKYVGARIRKKIPF